MLARQLQGLRRVTLSPLAVRNASQISSNSEGSLSLMQHSPMCPMSSSFSFSAAQLWQIQALRSSSARHPLSVTMTACTEPLVPSLGAALSTLAQVPSDLAIWLSSTMKKRRMKMNKHKLKKRRKMSRMNTKGSRS